MCRSYFSQFNCVAYLSHVRGVISSYIGVLVSGIVNMKYNILNNIMIPTHANVLGVGI